MRQAGVLVDKGIRVNNDAEARAKGCDTPLALPAQILDHAAGYLLASGIMAALYRRAIEGGSWHVQTSLAQVGHWVRHLGRVEGGKDCPDQRFADVTDLLEHCDTPFGELRSIRHAGILRETPLSGPPRPCPWDITRRAGDWAPFPSLRGATECVSKVGVGSDTQTIQVVLWNHAAIGRLPRAHTNRSDTRCVCWGSGSYHGCCPVRLRSRTLAAMPSPLPSR